MIITNEIRAKIIESREAGEPRAQTVRRIGCSRGTYDLTVQAYNAAKRGDTDELDRIAKISGPAARWAFGFVCVRSNKSYQPLPKVNAHDKFMPEVNLYPKAKDALFSRLHFLCELVDQAYFVEDAECLWRLRFILDAFKNEISSFENVVEKRGFPSNKVEAEEASEA